MVSGPSGVGKGTLISLLRERVSSVGLTVSATTREARPREVDGVSYYYMDDAEFDRHLAAGEFLEWAWVHGHRYGTLRSEVDRVLAGGESVVLEIDVQGGLSVRAEIPDAVLVFVEPPSMAELERRLRSRGTEDEAQIELRLANAREELTHAPDYDVRIVNDNLDRACSELEQVVHTYENDGGPSHNVCYQA